MSELPEPNGYDSDAKLIFAMLASLESRVSRIEYGTVAILVAVLVNLFMRVI